MLKYHIFTKHILWIKLFILTIIFVFMLGACLDSDNPILTQDSEEESEGPDPSQTKKWTVMLYDDADFDYAYDPVNDFSGAMFSSEHVDVLVLQDTQSSPAILWYIGEKGNKIKQRELGELNMGDYRSLSCLLEFAKTNCPAERYILSFYDHGAGWAGACVDVSDNHDWLSMDEMQKALSENGGVDLVFFTAPCLMGAVESVYELRDWTDVYVGSENVSGYCWWMDPVGDIRDTLNNTPDIDTYSLGAEVIESILDNSDDWIDYKPNLTMSAIRTDKISALKDALDELSADYLLRVGEFTTFIEILYSSIKSYYYSIDIHDFAAKLLSVETNAQTIATLNTLQNCLNDTVIAECHGEAMEESYGLSLYFPDPSQGEYNYLYGSPEYGLDFSQDTKWDDLLAAFFGPGRSRMAPALLEILRIPLLNPPGKNKK
jgi:hypothetical protein